MSKLTSADFFFMLRLLISSITLIEPSTSPLLPNSSAYKIKEVSSIHSKRSFIFEYKICTSLMSSAICDSSAPTSRRADASIDSDALSWVSQRPYHDEFLFLIVSGILNSIRNICYFVIIILYDVVNNVYSYRLSSNTAITIVDMRLQWTERHLFISIARLLSSF